MSDAERTPRISIVVTTVHRVVLLKRALRGFARQDVDFEAIVVHNGNVGIKELLASWQHKLPLRVIEISGRTTVAKRNAGWRAARGQLIAFTDDDCEPQAGWLQAAIDAFALGGEAVDLVQGRVDPHPDDANVHSLFRRTIEVRQHYEGYPNANLIYRRSALERVDGFDPAYWGAGEDADLAHRVIESGGGVVYDDNVRVWHAVRDVDFVNHLKSLPRWGNVALTMKRHPQLRPLIPHRVFWKDTHTTGSLALVGLLLMPFNWRFLTLLAPHLLRRVKQAGPRNGALLAVADVAEVACTITGSVRYRTFFL